MDLEDLRQVNATKRSRENFAKKVSQQPNLIPKLFNLITKDYSEEYTKKAAWILGSLYEHYPEVIRPFITEWSWHLDHLREDTSRRVLGKMIAQELQEYNYLQAEKDLCKNLIATFFDWLIDPHQVAVKVFAMSSLAELGTVEGWVMKDLKRILEEDYTKHSEAYQARARMTLNKIKKEV